MRQPRTILFSLFSLVAALAIVSTATAQQLRVETSVFVADDELPVSEATTLFDGQMVYHFMKEPAQTIIYRAPGANRDGEFLILDLDREQRTDISTKRIGGLMNKLNRWAAEQEDTLLKFSAQPIFDEEFDEETGILKMENPAWNYTVATVAAEDEKAMLRYREFTDWYSRLNAMLHSTPPPGARLALNKALSKHAVVPVEIRRRIESQDKSLRATHLFTWRLCRGKTVSVSTPTRGQLASFQKVGNAEFLARRKEEAVVRGQSK